MAVSYNRLWKLLIDKKMSKADLRKQAGLAPNTMTKLRRDEQVAMVVLETLGIDKKAPRVRFWMHLGVALLFEIYFVTDVYLLLSGYYFGDGFRLKRIAGAIAGIFLFFAEAYRAQHDWYAVLDEKKQKDEAEPQENL